MLVITVEVRGTTAEAQGVKELLGMALERFGDVRVVEVREETEQMRMMEFGDWGRSVWPGACSPVLRHW